MTVILGAILSLAAAISPSFGKVEGVKTYLIFQGEDEAIVAVVPEAFSSYEEKRAAFENAAKTFSKALERSVVLTDDSLSFAAIRRVERRGRSSDERYLIKRIRKIRSKCFVSRLGAY